MTFDQLSAQDAQYIYMEDADVPAHITGVYIFDQASVPGGIVRFRDIVEQIEKRLENAPIFRRRLLRLPMELDYPYWVDDPHFDIEQHIQHARLPEPADWRQFCIHVARYHSRPLDMGRPLWNMYVVEGLDRLEGVPEGSFALVNKVHHCTVDGTSGMQLMGALMDLGPAGPPAFTFPPLPRNSTPPGAPEVLTRAALSNARSPRRMIEMLGRSSPQIARVLTDAGRTRLGSRGAGVPPSPFNAPVTPRKCFNATSFALEDFKYIRTAFPEAKINDIVLATVGGGMRKYLEQRGILPAQPLIAMAPINARPKGSTPKAGAGNQISAMTVPIYSNIAHPVERLKAVTLATRRSKAAKDGVAARLLTDLSQNLPSSMMALASRFVLQNVANNQPMNNLIVSNVPGPQIPLYFCGARMLSMYGLAPLSDNMGLFITALSYDGRLTLSLTSTLDIMPDTDQVTAALGLAFEELKLAAARRLQAGKKKQTATVKARAKKKAEKKAGGKASGKGGQKKQRKKKAAKPDDAPKANGHDTGAAP